MDYQHVAAQQAAAKQAEFMSQILARLDKLDAAMQQLAAKGDSSKPPKVKPAEASE